MASTDNPSTVTASINYYIPPDNGVRAYLNVNSDPISGERERNFSLAPQDMVIENVRGKEDEYTLDKVGFQYHRSPAKHTSFLDDEEIKAEYYPETVELYKKLTGASKVVIFDHSMSIAVPIFFTFSLTHWFSHSPTPTW
jgi:hypothetical protein